jgi:nucleoside-diphosphate-sugar epimerase
MNNLVIGNTSQLSHYFPEDYIKISSRNLHHFSSHYNNVYICFAEQRTFLKNNEKSFFDINVDYTMKIIEMLYHISDRIVIYGTSELWNNCEGAINIHSDYNFNTSPYIESKKMLIERIKDFQDKVIVIHPFNFNTPYRKGDYLFGKIFKSILYKEKIEIGNTNFNRDVVPVSYIIERSLKADKDEIVGSGALININSFIKDLYKAFNMNYEDYVTENLTYNFKIQKEFYNESKTIYNYDTILEQTIIDLKKYKLCQK